MARKVFVFDDEIKPSTISELIYSIDDSNIVNSDNPAILLYFSTNGGVVSAAHILTDYLTRIVNEGVVIDLIVTDACHSSGLFFLASLMESTKKCKGCVNYSFFKYSESIFHEIALHLHTRDDNKNLDSYLIEIKERRAAAIAFFKKHITKDEISTFNNGGDVFFKADRLSKIFNGKVINIF